MNDYEKILLIFAEQATKKAKHNKMVKIKILTEDKLLFELMVPVIKYYAHSLHTRSVDEQEGFRALREYCTSMAYNKKPQWQVLAEKNGWSKNA